LPSGARKCLRRNTSHRIEPGSTNFSTDMIAELSTLTLSKSSSFKIR
jgi:hypothetical protein